MQLTDDILTLKEATTYLKLRNSQTLARLAIAKRVPGKKIGKQWRFHRAALEKFMGVSAQKAVGQ